MTGVQTCALPICGAGSVEDPPSGDDIVLYAGGAPIAVGPWGVVGDSTAAGGARISNANAGVKVNSAVADPGNYIELTFTASAGKAYRIWIRGNAASDSWANDSVFVQFSNSVTSSGTPTWRIGTTSATMFNLEDCSGCGLSNWGWQDNGYGVDVLGPLVYFASSGIQRIRIQTREDGLSIDQIVLSPSTFLSSAPGTLTDDVTVLPASSG